MNIYVVPEIDIERFKETGVFAVRLLNNEAMTHDGIYLESDGAKEFAELFEDNIFPAEKFEELVEWGIKADAKAQIWCERLLTAGFGSTNRNTQ